MNVDFLNAALVMAAIYYREELRPLSISSPALDSLISLINSTLLIASHYFAINIVNS